MSLRSADRGSARVTAVIHSLDRTGLPHPTVESVKIQGTSARVALVGSNGVRATVRLLKHDGYWEVLAVEAA